MKERTGNKMISRQEIQIRDPFVVPDKKQKIYYLYGSTDKDIWGAGTGFDAYTSRDLEQWEGPFEVFRPDETFWADKNFWAPEVHVHNGKFYMFASFKADGRCRGTQILISDSPLGPFVPHSDGPVTPGDWECLDGTFFLDDTGRGWMVFCHEWVQVKDGRMCAVLLSDDLRKATDSPLLLFTASQAPWCIKIQGEGTEGYITDGPFTYRAKNGELLMLWSSFTTDRNYALGIARSQSGKIQGPWLQDDEPLYARDGGHGMLFETFEGTLMLALHSPNQTPNERPVFREIRDQDGRLLSVE